MFQRVLPVAERQTLARRPPRTFGEMTALPARIFASSPLVPQSMKTLSPISTRAWGADEITWSPTAR
jgi:hypothetical protein